MSDKLVLRKGEKTAGYAPVFVSVEVHEKVKQLSADTGISMRDIVEACISFSLDRLEIVEADHATD